MRQSAKTMKVDRLFEMFWDVKDAIEENTDGTMSMSVVIRPKYGKFSIYVWYFLEIIRDLCKNLTFKKHRI